jgi:hypothetical protein
LPGDRHGGFGERPGETCREQSRQRAPGRLSVLTGTAGKLVGGRVWADGRMLRYDATGISANLGRLRKQREALAAKRAHYAALLAGLRPGDTRQASLTGLHGRADREHAHVCARIRNLNRALAWSAARWAVDQAGALEATVIYLEDLATLETRRRRKGNARLSGHVRGVLVDAIVHLAAKAGVAVVTVPARGTSRHCPRCGTGTTILRHTPAPDRTTTGWKWATCAACGLSADRDHAAAERIVSRGLLAQQHVRTDRATGRRTTHTVVEGNVARARRPKRPTRAARRARATDRDTHTRPERMPDRRKDRPTRKRPGRPAPATAFPQTPDRRLAPCTTPATGRDQRPQGQEPQTSPTARTGLARDSPRRTGFHHAHATPVIPLRTRTLTCAGHTVRNV